MVKLKHVRKAQKRLLQSNSKTVDTCYINYEYTFDRYRSGKYMHALLNTSNPVNMPALIMHELKHNSVKKSGTASTEYENNAIEIYSTNNKITINEETLSVKQLERSVYGYVSKSKNKSLNYKYWIVSKYLASK